MNKEEKIRELIDMLMSDDSPCTACEIRYQVLEELERLGIEE